MLVDIATRGERRSARRARGSIPLPWLLGLGLVLAVGLGLRLWGIGHGLPFVYNLDEGGHFAPNAVAYFSGSLDPDYFVNPPLYGYVLHLVFAAWFGREAAWEAYATDPTALFTVARVATALIGVGVLLAVFAAGRRLFDHRVGVLAAAILAVGFLPVFYSKHALNDVPTMLPVAIGIWAAVGVATAGSRRDWALAGIAVGLAAATKHTGGVVLFSILGAATWRMREPDQRRSAGLGVAAVLAVSVGAFFAAHPYAIIDFSRFWDDGIVHQQSASNVEGGKLGQVESSGHLYYLWALTWGLGWGVALFALLGSLSAIRERALQAVVLVPVPVLFILFMGAQGRFFGRWLMPVLPFVAILAAYGGVRLWEWIAGRRPRLAPVAAVAVALGLLGQGVVYSMHSGLVLSREDTRNELRSWMEDNIPPGSRLVLEPFVPIDWLHDPGEPSPVTSLGHRWSKYGIGEMGFDDQGRRLDDAPPRITVESYIELNRPELLERYDRLGYCWVLLGSWQFGRAFAQPEQAPEAIAFYERLNRVGVPVWSTLPYEGQARTGFNFDWTFGYYPLAFDRPGPEIFVYRIPGRHCDPLPERATGDRLDLERWGRVGR